MVEKSAIDKFTSTLDPVPGNIHIVIELLKRLDLKTASSTLDISGPPFPGAIGAMIEYKCHAHVTVFSDDEMSQAKKCCSEFSIRNPLSAQIGLPSSIPWEESTFDSVISIAAPVPLSLTPGIISEIYRVLKPGGYFAWAGPASYTNDIPTYMKLPLRSMQFGEIKTPALTALIISHTGFHILNAEIFKSSWEHWEHWLEVSDNEKMTDEFRKSLIRDHGSWLALGIIIVKKPPKPEWAL
jgi:ubiquinone/menaquinone biosynthesis C-methylase UbiE